jgi:hypothetical protein
LKTARVSENERLEITPDSIFFKGVEFQTSEVKMTFYNRANKHKGSSRILFTAIIYIAIMAVILVSPVYTMLFNYMFFIYFPWGVSFLYLVYRIYMNYILEYVIVQFGASNEKLFKVNNKKNSALIDLLKDRSFLVTYVELGKGLQLI